MMSAFTRAVRAALGLERELPVIDRMAQYRAEVKAASSDGKTVDVQPEASYLQPHSGVKMRVGIPGATVVVKAGAIVLLGWEAGDPSKPYAVPSWEQGAGVTKLVFTADGVFWGAESGAQKTLLAEDFIDDQKAMLLTLDTILLAGTAGSPVKQLLTMASQLATDTFYTNMQSGGSAYLSTVTKNK